MFVLVVSLRSSTRRRQEPPSRQTPVRRLSLHSPFVPACPVYGMRHTSLRTSECRTSEACICASPISTTARRTCDRTSPPGPRVCTALATTLRTEAVVLLGWPCIAQQKQPQGLSSGQVEFERRLACQKARCSRAEQWVSYSCTGVQPFGVAPRGTSQTCHPGSSPGRSYGVILQLRRGVAPCEVRAAMTAR